MLKGVECPVNEQGILIERRSGIDRRKNRFRFFRPFSKARRRQLRRQSDRCRIHFLDYYNPKILYLVILVILLSLLDALLTLWLLGNGAQELNPVMAFFLQFGPIAFITSKHLFTSISVVIIVLLYHTRIHRMKFQLGHLLYFFAMAFVAVVIWEITLINLSMP